MPIVELLNVACIQIWGEQIIHTEEPAILSESDSCGVIAYNDTERVSFTCDFNGMEKDFVLYVDGSILKLNKLSLFKLLYQWHFAIDIPDGTWIDINTL